MPASNHDEEVMLNIREFSFRRDLPPSATIVIVGAPGTGKSNLLEYIVWILRDRYPCHKIFDESDEIDKRWSLFVHDLYINHEYNEKENEIYVSRQKKCINDPVCVNSNAICITNDCSADTNIFKTKLINGKFKNGSRRWGIDCYGLQYIKDVPPSIRKSMSYAIIFREKNIEEREKVWKTLGGECGTKSDFFQIWDQLSGDFDFMVINKRTQSNNLEDMIFFGNVLDMRKIPKEDLRCGCKEAWEYGEKRYNPNWRETDM